MLQSTVLFSYKYDIDNLDSEVNAIIKGMKRWIDMQLLLIPIRKKLIILLVALNVLSPVSITRIEINATLGIFKIGNSKYQSTLNDPQKKFAEVIS